MVTPQASVFRLNAMTGLLTDCDLHCKLQCTKAKFWGVRELVQQSYDSDHWSDQFRCSSAAEASVGAPVTDPEPGAKSSLRFVLQVVRIQFAPATCTASDRRRDASTRPLVETDPAGSNLLAATLR